MGYRLSGILYIFRFFGGAMRRKIVNDQIFSLHHVFRSRKTMLLHQSRIGTFGTTGPGEGAVKSFPRLFVPIVPIVPIRHGQG